MWLEAFKSVVKVGAVIDLAHTLEVETPHHPNHAPYMFRLTKSHGDVTYAGGASASNDMFSMGTHIGTHIDGLGHIACCGVIHGPRKAEDFQSVLGGFREVGIDSVKPIVCRGVMLDIAGLHGVKTLGPGHEITIDDMERACARQGVSVQAGDAVLLRTGWSANLGDPRSFVGLAGSPGPGLPAAKWLLERGMSITGSDTLSYELQPAPSLPVHVELLVNRGLHIIEALNLDGLVEAGVGTFVFICLPLKIKGGTGSPIRPVALY